MDLDNTLIEEKDYLFQAYDAIARLVAPEAGRSSAELRHWLVEEFEARGRQNLLQVFFVFFDISDSHLLPSLEILRSVRLERPLKLAAWALEALPSASSSLAILTNGNPSQQKNKILQSDLLQLRPDISVIYANEVAPKPSPAGLLKLMAEFGVKENQTLLLGDSEVDEECARNAGAHFVRATVMGLES